MRNTVQLFNEDLPKALAAHADDAKTVGAKFQFNIAGAGEWFCDLTATGPTCVPGTQKADCAISITDKDFQALMANPEGNAVKFFMFGKIKVDGNKMLGLKLQKILGYLSA